jgi:hypothetical protein
MTQLLDIQQLLVNEMNTNPALCLANAVAWLDPFWDEFTDEDDDYAGDGGLGLALRVVRNSFPALYIQVIEQLREGCSWDDIDRFVCREIEKLGIPLENLEWMGYGIPLPSYGVKLEEPDFYESHADFIPILAPFGIDPTAEDDNVDVDVPECTHIVGQFIAEDLEQHPDERYRQLSWLLQWLFSCSGNSVIDLDYEAMCEFQPLSWDKDDLEFAIAIIQEADEIMPEALKGLAFLQSTPEVSTALGNNVRRIYKALSKCPKENRHDKPRVRCIWPSPGTGAD